MHPSSCGTTLWLLILAAVCGLWRLRPTMAIRQSQQNQNPAITQFGIVSNTWKQCFEKIIFAKSRSPAAVSHMAVPYKIDTGMVYTYVIRFVKVETLDDTYGGAIVEIIGGRIGFDYIVLSITDGNRKPVFKSNIKVTMFCGL